MKFDGTDNYITLKAAQRRGRYQIKPSDQGGAKRTQVSRFFLAALLVALVLLAAFQSVEIMGHGARLDVLEAPPEIVYRDIAIDPLAVESPVALVRHKVSLKYKTRDIIAAHNEGDKGNG